MAKGRQRNEAQELSIKSTFVQGLTAQSRIASKRQHKQITAEQ